MVHLFYIESHFHVLVVDQIIQSNSLGLDECYFVTERGTVLPERYRNHLVYDGTTKSLFTRIRQYYSGQLKLKQLSKEKICAYMPFQFFFPSKRYFNKYMFFEEGFSAYSLRTIASYDERSGKRFVKRLIICLSLPFARKNTKGLIAGIFNDGIKPFETTLYRLSDDAYKGMENVKGIDVETIQINNNKPFVSSEIRNAMVVVMDRLSPKGRPFDDVIYLKVLVEALNKCYDSSRKMYVKLHPSDYKNEAAKERIELLLSAFHPVLFDESLENLAICNQNNTFFGSNSTVLYYAPILGSSNKSISFSRILAEKDETYRRFLNNWSRTEGFIKLFKKQVEIL